MKRNGKTAKGTPRWRCKNPDCGASTTKSNTDAIHTARFRVFMDWIMGTRSLDQIAASHKHGLRTLTRWFKPFWAVQIPDNTDHHRVYDQIFIDGTYFNTNCLLVASTTDHVVAWHWCFTEDAYAYSQLLNKLAPPKVVTTDGQKGALKAIKSCWPDTRIQRCLVHVKRNIQTYVTLNPQTPAGKALRKLSLDLLRITTTDQATEWVINLQKFHTVFRDWLNEKTYLKDITDESLIPKSKRNNKKWWYTHYRTRSAYTLLERLVRNHHLFTYLTPPDEVSERKATTNSLEGGINAAIKTLLHNHRGLPEGHQRVICDWWLYLHTQLPGDPEKIARQQHWGQAGLAKAQAIITQEHEATYGNADGRPATYDTAIDSTPTNSIGIRKGWAGRH